MEKICSKCKILQPTKNFRIDKAKKNGLYSSCKECCSKLEKARYEANKKAIQAKRKANMTDEMRKHKADYDKKYREKLGETRLLSKRDYYHNRGGKERGKEWNEANYFKVLASRKQSKAKRKGKLSISSITTEAMKTWLMEQVPICSYCGILCKNTFQIDHIDPLSKTGFHEFDNLAISCKSCNCSKSSKPLILWYATNRSTG